MRKFLIAMLLAGAAATPAIAGHDPDHHQSSDNHESHQQAHEEHQQSHAERPQFTAPRMQAPQIQARQQGFNGGGQHVEGQRVDGHPNFGGRFQGNAGVAVQDNGVRHFEGDPRVRVEQQQSYVAPGPRMVNAPRERVRGQRVEGGDFRQFDRAVPNGMRGRGPLAVSNVPRFGTQPPLTAEGRHHHVNWNSNWRNDRRYDWRDRRRHHPSLFHFGIFIDPFGWDYQPFSIGYRMWPAYYGNQYWIDPAEYGLPYPPPGAVWVRYWNDAILVDTYSGTVIDVIPNFFW